MSGFDQLNDKFRAFIEEQPMFFVGTAGQSGRVNVSPKGMDSLRILSDSRIIWINLSGSGNETAAHVLEQDRMTLMFCAFKGYARILRVYGHASVIHPRDAEWPELQVYFDDMAGSRQIFDLSIDFVQTSCGTGVPLMHYEKQRGYEELIPYYEKMGDDGVKRYWAKKNTQSIDGRDTGIFE